MSSEGIVKCFTVTMPVSYAKVTVTSVNENFAV